MKQHCLAKTPLLRLLPGRSLLCFFISLHMIMAPVLGQTTNPGQRTVLGKVVAASGTPLQGATVSVVNTNLNAVTDSAGNFSLRVPGKATLEISFIGYEKTQVELSASASKVQVTLQPAANAMSDVVVIGYGTQKRRDVTGSIASLNTEQLEKRPVTSFDQSLQGMAPGVQVMQNNGAPGGTVSVRIRGSNSILGGNEPLYVVDGVPMMSGSSGNTNILSTINPADIKSIDILKDASSTAIYGARGANGVVLITTKSGLKNANQLDFNYSFGLQDVIKKIKMANARQFAEMVNERAVNDNETFVPFPDLDKLPHNTDWQEEVYRVAPMQNYSLSFSGGSAKTQYFVSGNYFDQEGLMPNTDFKRYAARFNLDSKISDKFSIGTQFQLSETGGSRTVTENNSYALMLSLVGAAPTASVYNPDGSYGDPFPVYFTENYDNPLATLRDRLDQLTTQRMIGNVNAKYDIIKGLDFSVRAGIDRLSTENDNYIKRTLSSGQPNGRANKSYVKNTVLLIESILHYNRKWKDHAVDVMAGNTLQSGKTSSFSASAQDFLTDYFLTNNLGAGASFNQPSSNLTNWSLNSWMGRINYSLKDRYLFTLTGRADGSSRFGKDNKWGWFPSAAIAWQIANESFMSRIPVISNAKLRASWGVTGNQEIGLYQSLQQIVPVTLGMGDAVVVGFAPNNIANPNLKWEQTDQYNVGLDLAFLNNRFTFSADYYLKNTNNLLALVQLPTSSGFASSIQNIGEIRNKGFELLLGAQIVQNKDFNWSANLNITANRNKVTQLAGGNDIFGVNGRGVIRVGEPLGNFYDYVIKGIDPASGDIVYNDLDGNGAINSLDRKIVGYSDPDFIYGLTNNVSFRQFDLSVFIQGVQGNEIYNESFSVLANSMTRARNQVLDVYNYRWRPGHDNTNAKYPKLSVRNTLRNEGGFGLEDGSYLRVKNIRLGYQFKPGLVKFVKNASLYISAQNLITLTSYRWVDPDVSSYGTSNVAQGIDRLSYPTAKIYTIGLQVRF